MRRSSWHVVHPRASEAWIAHSLSFRFFLFSAHRNTSAPPILFDVSGTHYSVGEATLCKFADSWLAKQYTTSWRDAASVRHFVDRDGAAFRWVLHFLRGGDQGAIRALSTTERTVLAAEAKFYGLADLEKLCSTPLPSVLVATYVSRSHQATTTIFNEAPVEHLDITSRAERCACGAAPVRPDRFAGYTVCERTAQASTFFPAVCAEAERRGYSFHSSTETHVTATTPIIRVTWYFVRR